MLVDFVTRCEVIPVVCTSKRHVVCVRIWVSGLAKPGARGAVVGLAEESDWLSGGYLHRRISYRIHYTANYYCCI